MSETFQKQQSYFSALARGGLQAAKTAAQAQGVSSPCSPTDPSSGSAGRQRSKIKNGKSSQGNRRNNSNSSSQRRRKIMALQDKENIENYENQRKLNSLMQGIDLPPLQEEVSKEEDSIMEVMLKGEDPILNPSHFHPSIGSECNYDSKIDEEQIWGHGDPNFQVQDTSNPRIFDPQYQHIYDKSYAFVQDDSCSKSKADPFTLKAQVQNQQYNLKPKQKPKPNFNNVIEQLQNSHSRGASSYLDQDSSLMYQASVEQRLFECKKKTEEKIEQLRREQHLKEQMLMKQSPNICQKSNEIVMLRSMHKSVSPNSSSPPRDATLYGSYAVDPKTYQEEQRRREVARLQIVELQELKGFTGKPEINKKSRSIKRKVDDLLDWKEKQDLKRQGECKRKVEEEQMQIQRMQSHRVVSKQSEKLLENRMKNGARERVQERLYREASLRKNRQAAQEKQRQQELQQRSAQKYRKRSQSQNNKVAPSNNMMFSKIGSEKKKLHQSLQSQDEVPSISSQLACIQNQNERPFDNGQLHQVQPYEMSQHQNPQFNTFDFSPRQNQFDLPQYQRLQNQAFGRAGSTAFSPQKPVIPTRYSLQGSIQNSQVPQCVPNYQPSGKNHSFQENGVPQLAKSFPNAISPPQYSNQLSERSLQMQGQPVQNSIQPKPFQYNPQQQSTKKKPTTQYQSLFSKLQMMNNSANQSQNSPSYEDIHTSRMTTSSNGNSHNQQMTFAYQNPQYQVMHQQQLRQQDQIKNQKAMSPSSDLYQRNQAQKQQQHPHWHQHQLGDYPWQQQQQEAQHISQSLDLNNQLSQFPSSETVMMSQTLPKPVLQSHLQSSMAYHQHQPQPYQNIIINKMLENSYIPSGNGKDVRRVPYTFEEPIENLNAHLSQHPQQDLPNSCRDQSRLFNSVNPNNQAQIEETEMYNTGNSDTNIIKNLSQALDQQDVPQQRHKQNPPSKAHAINQGSSKHLAFQDRNNQWLQQRQQNIEKAKEILDMREERQCPFKPQTQISTQNLVRSTTRSRSSKGKEQLFSPKLPNSKELKEEGIQVNAGLEPFQHSMINSNSTSSQLRKFDEANQISIAHTTNKLNEAIDLMCLYDSSGQGNKDCRMLDLSKECDATCLTPGAKPNPDESNIESASFLSLGGNERDIYDHQAIPVPVQTMKIKQLNF